MNNNKIQSKDIIGFATTYQISNDGNVKSKSTNQLIKNHLEKNDYYTVRLCGKNKTSIKMYIHELVASHFLNEKNTNNKVVIHKDGDKSNNNYLNLEYVDFSDDVDDCHKKISKHVFQYDLEYNFIKEWNSIDTILNNNKDYKQSAIRNNVCNISKSAYGSIWSYDNELKKPENKIISIIDEKYFIDQNIYEYPDDKEYWKDIIGYETRYKISNYGKVYSKQLNILLNTRERGGYHVTKLRDTNQTEKMQYVHILVARHFIQNNNNYKIIHHKDHNKLNNHYINLEWTTHSANTKAYHDNKDLPEILQYDLEGNLIKEWKSINEVLEFNKEYKKESLKKCLNGKYDKMYNFVWKYKNSNVNDKKEIDNTLHEDEEFRNIGIFQKIDFSLYEVSNYGKVRNTETNLILRPGLSTTRYLQVCLVDNNKKKFNRKIHRLVAHKFVEGHSDINNYVNHIDENVLNNYYKNLEWCTNKHNSNHSTGKKVNQIDIETNEIIKTFDSLAEAAKIFGKDNAMCIIKVCQHKKKTAYGYKWEYFDKYIEIINKNENIINKHRKLQLNIQIEYLNITKVIE